MDAATKKAADREYVDRFFHGVASKLMTHPYFSKFANQANMSAEVPASVAQLDVVLRAVAAEKAAEAKPLLATSAVHTVERTAVSLDQYTANMKHVRELFGYRSTLLQKLKTCPKAQDKAISAFVQEIDDRIKAVYASEKPQGVDDINERIKKMECTPLGTDDKGDADVEKDGLLKRFGNQLKEGNWLSGPRPISPLPSPSPSLAPVPSPPATSLLDQSPFNGRSPFPDTPIGQLSATVPKSRPINPLPEKHVANVQSALARYADILTQKANELQQDLNDNPQRKDANAIERQIAAYQKDAESVLKESPQQTELIELIRPDRSDRVGRPNLSDEQIAAIIARKHEPSPFSTRLAQQALHNGGRIQRRRSIKRGKINKNKRPQ